ncbi:MAG: thioredoxin family protein [Bacteroidales bacterium]|jgi:thiol-disulfide isomerase/thioredoxin
MKKLIILIAMMTIVMCINAQEINKTKIDEKSQMEVLIGLCNRDGLKSDLFKTYYDAEYDAYKPHTIDIGNLKSALANKNITVIIVMGSWCGDSQEQVPRFFKIIDAIGFTENNVTIYCVDRNKKTDKGEIDNLKITLVPTFIFYKDGKEIGRIVESPKATLEKDMLEII